MIFNETAYAIGHSIPRYAIKKMKPHSVRLDQIDMSEIDIVDYGVHLPVICREGWSLNDI